MNIYTENMKWAESVHERLMLGIKIYGADSDFMSGYACRCMKMDKDDMEDFFDKWELHTRSRKLKQILIKRDNVNISH